MTDASGVVSSSASYDSFGNATGNLNTRYQYTGREYDSFTGLYFYRARWYDSNLGRFISEDPIGFAGGDVNLFVYVKNNPLNFKDPKGTAIVPILIIGGVALGETVLHRYLHNRAFDMFPETHQDRERHCYVNCMSMRLHLGNPTAAIIFSGIKEVGDLGAQIVGYGEHPTFYDALDDAGKDMHANSYGQFNSFIIWKWCKEICEQCPTRR